MPVEVPGFKFSKEAAADLSAKQFHFVKLDANGRIAAIAAITDRPCGILQNKPSALGQAAEIMADGISRLVGGANVAKGDMLGTSAVGRAVAIVSGVDVTQYALGTIMDDSDADGQECSVLFDCKNAALAK